MLPDPMNVTVEGSSRSMPRVSSSAGLVNMQLQASAVYKTADGAYTVETRRFLHRGSGSQRMEIFLRKQVLDTDPATVHGGFNHSGFGLVFEFGPYGPDSTVITALRTALSTHVDSAFVARILAGEV
jgi:hypothetical protein